MAWSILRKNVPGKIPTFRSFVVDTTSDITTLPNNVAWGSEAFCIEDGKVYILETTGEWAEKLSGGGSSIEVEAKEITVNGTYTADEGKAFSPVTVNVPNPNYVETIEGTMASPFGEHTVIELVEGINNNSMTVILQISLQGQTAVLPGAILGYLRFNLAIAIDSTMGWQNVAEVSYYNDGNIYNALYDVRGSITDLKPMANSISTVLTIIHHPLPETP